MKQGLIRRARRPIVRKSDQPGKHTASLSCCKLEPNRVFPPDLNTGATMTNVNPYATPVPSELPQVDIEIAQRQWYGVTGFLRFFAVDEKDISQRITFTVTKQNSQGNQWMCEFRYQLEQLIGIYFPPHALEAEVREFAQFVSLAAIAS